MSTISVMGKRLALVAMFALLVFALVSAPAASAQREAAPLRVTTPHANIEAMVSARGGVAGMFPALTAASFEPGHGVVDFDAMYEQNAAQGEVIGTFKTLAILVQFSNKPATESASFFDQLLFDTTGPATGVGASVNTFYKAVSYGQLDMVTLDMPSDLGWQTAANPYEYYVGTAAVANPGGGYCFDYAYPNNCQRLAEELVAAVDSVVDFSEYDNDGDGYVDTVYLIHSGPGAEFTGETNDVWSHSWNVPSEPTVDGVQISNYTIEPEYWGDDLETPPYGPDPTFSFDMTIGVYAHEFGHALGIPDLYDVDGSGQGIGRWSLMSGGSWNGPNIPGVGTLGDYPANMDAWSRWMLGWETSAVTVNSTQPATLPNVNASTNPTDVRVFIIPTGEYGEYFMVENRQKNGLDIFTPPVQPGSGLLIWHVSEEANTYFGSNNNECLRRDNFACGADHFLIALEQADGLLQLELNLSSGNQGDVWPGNTGKTSFNFWSSPSSSSYWTTENTGRAVHNISAPGEVMTADLYVDMFTTPEDLDSPADFDGDDQSQLVTFGAGGAWLMWDYDTATTQYAIWTGLGSPTAQPIMMDYDDDASEEMTIYDSGAWHFFNDDGSYNKGIWTGGLAGDIPAPADYDGDGDDDVVVFSGGAWQFFDFATGAYVPGSSVWTGTMFSATPQPAPGDYDGDGIDEYALWTPDTFAFHKWTDNGSFTYSGVWIGHGGTAVPGDYDGDRNDDVVIYNAGAWQFFEAAWVGYKSTWTGAGGTPVALDWNGDGSVDPTMHFATGHWQIFDDGGNLHKVIATTAGYLPVD